MIRRFVPSLSTEMHLTIRLLHVHSEVELSRNDRVSRSERDRQEDPSSSRHIANSPTAAAETRLKEREECQGGVDDKPEEHIVFNTGLDCRSFAASVLLGLKSLLPHIGMDTLDLLAESLALASQVKIGAIYFVIVRCDMLCAGGVKRLVFYFVLTCCTLTLPFASIDPFIVAYLTYLLLSFWPVGRTYRRSASRPM